MRESFIFYKSFYESIKELEESSQYKIYKAIFEYQFENKTSELNGIEKAIFTLIEPQLSANNKKYENGKKGGAPKGNSNASKQPKNNLKTTKKQPKNNLKQANVNENDNENVNENDNDIKKIIKKEKNNRITKEELGIYDYNWLEEE